MKKYLILVLLFLGIINVYAALMGDVNNDGKVNSTDYVLIRKHILKQTTLSKEKLTRADINSDGKVNSMDYVKVRKIILKRELAPTSTPTSKPSPTATPKPTPTSTPTSKPTPKPTPTNTPKPTPTSKPSPTAKPTPTATPKPTPTTKPSPTATPKTEYTITFNANGGKVSTKSKKVKYNEKYGILPTPTRSGYKFLGWFTSKDGKFDYKYYADKYKDLKDTFGYNENSLKNHWYGFGINEGRVCSKLNRNSTSVYKNTGNETLYAVWEAETYVVSFDANGGSVSPSSMKVEFNKTYGALPTPTRSGYKFVGWFTSKDGKFDYKYYADKYKDLKDTFGYNETNLKNHWYSSGRSEGRVCSELNRNSTSVYKNTGNETLYAIWEYTGFSPLPQKLQSGFNLHAEYNSSTLKYWIERSSNAKGTHGSSNMYLTHIWVKDPANQIKVALGGKTTLGNNKPEALLNGEINRLSLGNKGLVAVNASFFGDSGVPSWGSTQSTPVIIHEGKLLRNDVNMNFDGKNVYSAFGITKDGTFKFYNMGAPFRVSSKNQMINDGVKYSGAASGIVPKNSTETKEDSKNIVCIMNMNNYVIITAYNMPFKNAAEVGYKMLGCQSLINIDGGGSLTLLYKYNTNSIQKSSFVTDRSLPDMLYFVE